MRGPNIVRRGFTIIELLVMVAIISPAAALLARTRPIPSAPGARRREPPASTTTGTRRRVRAFSLIELFVVVAILGVISALVVPSISTQATRRAAATEVTKVQTDLDAARDLARARLRCVHVTRVSAAELRVDELQPSGADCGTIPLTTVLKTYNASLIDLTTDIDITFDRTGGLADETDDYVDLTVSERHPPSGTLSPRTLRVFRVLGLVRRI